MEIPRIKVLKRDGSKEDFCRSKLLKGIATALEKRPFSDEQIDGIVSDIELELAKIGKREVASRDIGNVVIRKLKSLDPVAYLRFISVYKKFASAKSFQKEAEKLNS